jgi:hypothetical protein
MVGLAVGMTNGVTVGSEDGKSGVSLGTGVVWFPQAASKATNRIASTFNINLWFISFSLRDK